MKNKVVKVLKKTTSLASKRWKNQINSIIDFKSSPMVSN